MSRRGRHRKLFKFNLKHESFQSISAIVLLFLSGISIISYFTPSGQYTILIRNKTVELFGGLGAILVPVWVGILGLFVLNKIRARFLQVRVVTGFTLAVFPLICLMTLLGRDGGVFGRKLTLEVERAISRPGALLLFVALFSIGVLLTFNTSLDRLLDFFEGLYKGLRKAVPLGKIAFPIAFNRKEVAEDTSLEKMKGELPKFEIVASPSEPVTARNKGELSKSQEEALREDTVVNMPYSDQVWEYPPLDLLSDATGPAANRGDVNKNAQIIEKTLDSFGIKARVSEVNPGPAVTQYALESAQGTKITKITNLQNDLAMALASPTGSVRLEAPIPGKSLIGIEVPNFSPMLVTIKSILASEEMKKSRSKLTVSLGLDVSGKPWVMDIAKMPHVLVAGATGSGKSVLLHSFLTSLLFRCSPAECKFILVDPKRVELPLYNDIPHLLTPVIVDPQKALPSLKWALAEMSRRYRLFENAKVRDINGYNELSGFQALPFIVILVDELADMMAMAPVEVEKSVCRLAQMSRATGIHLILATQRPSVDVLTGLIKANIPCRIAFNVVSQVDSRVIIDQVGAEKLLGRGDMFFVPPDSARPIRLQGAWVSEKERFSLIEFLKKSSIKPEYKEDVTEFEGGLAGGKNEAGAKPSDPLFAQAVEIVCLHERASSSLLQRRLQIGYARAARLLDDLEARRIVGPSDGSKPREVLIRDPKEVLKKFS